MWVFTGIAAIGRLRPELEMNTVRLKDYGPIVPFPVVIPAKAGMTEMTERPAYNTLS
jgi:hypothetical protein